jgi:hypothetical protein
MCRFCGDATENRAAAPQVNAAGCIGKMRWLSGWDRVSARSFAESDAPRSVRIAVVLGPDLAGARLRLRAPRVGDFRRFSRWYADPDVVRYWWMGDVPWARHPRIATFRLFVGALLNPNANRLDPRDRRQADRPLPHPRDRSPQWSCADRATDRRARRATEGPRLGSDRAAERLRVPATRAAQAHILDPCGQYRRPSDARAGRLPSRWDSA